MSNCYPITKYIHLTDCKIMMLKDEKQIFSALSRAEISSLSNFHKICLYFLVGGSLFNENKLN